MTGSADSAAVYPLQILHCGSTCLLEQQGAYLRPQVLASFEAFFRGHTSQARIEPIETHIAGDWAWARTRVSGTLTPKSGGPSIELSSREIAILRRQSDGSWKVARLIGNSAPPERAGGGE